MLRKLPFLVVLLMFLVACAVEKREIRYGTEACEYCKMIIVNKQFATEMVTKKGKIHVYDSIECLLNARHDQDLNDVALTYVSDYADPGTLLPAEQSVYLQSEQIPSPMGDNLTAFRDETTARKFQAGKGGTLYSWETLQEMFNQQHPAP